MDSYRRKQWELWNYDPKIAKILTYDSVYKQIVMIDWPDMDFIDLSTLCKPFPASHLGTMFFLGSRQKKLLPVSKKGMYQMWELSLGQKRWLGGFTKQSKGKDYPSSASKVERL